MSYDKYKETLVGDSLDLKEDDISGSDSEENESLNSGTNSGSKSPQDSPRREGVEEEVMATERDQSMTYQPGVGVERKVGGGSGGKMKQIEIEMKDLGGDMDMDVDPLDRKLKGIAKYYV